MPSLRKRIGYLPTPIVQDLINQISSNEKLSQSKVVGILVEEALLARGVIDSQRSKYLNSERWNKPERTIYNTTYKYNDLDELISDKGITYNKKEYKVPKNNSKDIILESREEYNSELFEQFKQFLLFQKTLQEK
tara:strand:+ start:11199 stop:11603 length:405 start_codon:yes stop_codon:yes gene_type:complete